MRNAMVLDISVTDTGKGISPNKIDKVFDSFTQEISLYFKKIRWYRAVFQHFKRIGSLNGGEI